MGCKPFSSFLSNVSSSIEKSAILYPYASYKENFDAVAWREELRLVNSLQLSQK